MTQHDNPELRQNLNPYFLTRKEKTAMLWQFGENGAVGANTYFQQIGSATMLPALGFVAPFDIAIWGYGITRLNGNAGTIEIRDNGVAVVSIVMGANLLLANYINEVTIAAGRVMTTYWNSGLATADVQGYVFCYVRP
jgi:hypothetical protein